MEDVIVLVLLKVGKEEKAWIPDAAMAVANATASRDEDDCHLAIAAELTLDVKLPSQ